MRIKHFIIAFVTLSSIFTSNAQGKKFIVHTVAFYNFENLFDTIITKTMTKSGCQTGLKTGLMKSINKN